MKSCFKFDRLLTDFSVKRKLTEGDGMSMGEFMYPLLQGWDFWHMYSRLGIQMQIGGSDQYGNIVAGIEALKTIRESEEAPHAKMPAGWKHDPIGFTVPLLTDSAGVKFGKSAGNAVWLDEFKTSAFDHVVPDGVGATVLGYWLRSLDQVRMCVVILNHGELVLRDTKGSPEKALLSDDEVGNELGEEGRTDPVSPNLTLFVQSLGVKNLLDCCSDAKECRNPAHGADGMTRATCVVEAVTFLVLEDVSVLHPVLESTAGKMRRQLGDEQLGKLRVLSITKNLPKVLIRKRSVSCCLQLQQVILRWVEVDGVDASWALGEVRENIVASRGNSENLVIGTKLEDTLVNAGIFPGKRIDVLIVELGMLLQLVIVVDAPMVVLVEESREGQIGGEVLNSGDKCLGANLWCGSFDSTRQSIALVGRVQVRGLGGQGINAFKNLMRQTRRRKRFLVASNPDIVGNVTEGSVT